MGASSGGQTVTRRFSRRAMSAALAFGSIGLVPAMALEADETPVESAGEDESTEPSGKRARKQLARSEALPWIGNPIEVSAKGTAADWPTTLATDVLNYDDAIAMPADFQDWIVGVPGIGATGQNGIFETFSIRGNGGNRILILVGGIPVTSQRRAGVPLSFVEPYLLGDVNVTRGPSVVHFGPGALGGAISLEPRWFDAPFVAGGYASAGNESVLAAGTGSDGFSVGAARHRADDSESPDGLPLNTSFERSSATVQLRRRVGEWVFDGLLMPSRTENIGKSNIRFPDRQATTYPEDEHTIGRVRLRHDNGFQASLYAHDQELSTFKQTPGEPDEFAFIASTDGGATAQQTWQNGDFTNDVGIEYFARRSVTGYDAVGNPGDRTYSLDGAHEDTWSLFGLTDWRLAPDIALELGARATTIRQVQSGASSNDSDAAFTAGAVWTPGETTRWILNLASGYRFATLEERFYSGVTGRGEIVGNPNLGSEHSLGADLGFAWWSVDWGAEIHVWRTEIENFIEKIELEPDVEGYVNLGQGDLYGAEAIVDWTPIPQLALRAGGAVVRGEDDNGLPLAGVPPLRVSLEATYDIGGKVTLASRYTHRWNVTRPGFEEVERDAVDVVDAEARLHIRPGLDVELYLRNAFDESYYATADELSTFAPERSIGINVVWAMH